MELAQGFDGGGGGEGTIVDAGDFRAVVASEGEVESCHGERGVGASELGGHRGGCG